MLRGGQGGWFSWFWSCWWNVLLRIAAEGGHEGVVRALIAVGADVRAVDIWEVTPLHLAAQLGHEGVARVLVEAGADVRAPDFRRDTPLHVAVLGGHEGMVRLLMEGGADVRDINTDYMTPLHLAAWLGHEGVARVLVEKGADVRAGDRYRRTPLQIAAWYGHEGVARMLAEAGAILVTCAGPSSSGDGGFGGAQGGSDSSGDEDNSPYENYRKTTSANKEMDMALLDNESKVSREDLHAHYLFVYGENNEEILQLLQKLYDPESLDNFKEEEQEQEQEKQEDNSDYPSENKSKHNEFMQELLEAEMNPSRGSIPFSIPEFNEKTVDMSLPKDGARRQDPLMDPDADVPWMEPRLDLSSGEGRKDPEVTLENNLREASDGEDYIDVTSNFISRLPGDHGFDALQAGMLALAMGGIPLGVSGEGPFEAHCCPAKAIS